MTDKAGDNFPRHRGPHGAAATLRELTKKVTSAPLDFSTCWVYTNLKTSDNHLGGALGSLCPLHTVVFKLCSERPWWCRKVGRRDQLL